MNVKKLNPRRNTWIHDWIENDFNWKVTDFPNNVEFCILKLNKFNELHHRQLFAIWPPFLIVTHFIQIRRNTKCVKLLERSIQFVCLPIFFEYWSLEAKRILTQIEFKLFNACSFQQFIACVCEWVDSKWMKKRVFCYWSRACIKNKMDNFTQLKVSKIVWLDVHTIRWSKTRLKNGKHSPIHPLMIKQ